jgi:VanZ family protein
MGLRMAGDVLMKARVPLSWAVDVLVVLSYIGAVFYAATRPQGPTLPEGIPGTDKLVHFSAFGGMVVLVWRAMRPATTAWGRTQQLVVAGAISSGLGALLEVVQLLTPPRSADFWDWVADTLGIVLAGAATFRFLGRLSARAVRTEAAAGHKAAESRLL